MSLGIVSGQEEYQDHWPFAPMNVHSISVTMVQCTNERRRPAFSALATINGSGSFTFQIDVEDNGEPGTSDKYRMQVNGYDSGLQTLEGECADPLTGICIPTNEWPASAGHSFDVPKYRIAGVPPATRLERREMS